MRMTNFKISSDHLLADFDGDNETSELIRNAYRVIDSVYQDIRNRSSLRPSPSNHDEDAHELPVRELDTQRRPPSLEVLDTSVPDVIFEDNTSLNSTSTHDINSTVSSPCQSISLETSTHPDIEDDVVIVSSNLSEVIDLCTPVHEAPRRRRRTSSSYRQQRSMGNLSPSRNLLPFAPNNSSTCLYSGTTSTNRGLSGLPIGAKNAPDTTSDRSILICPVCMESSVQRNPTSTKCGHVFCEGCINTAVRLSKKCPLCNKRLTNRMLFRIYL